MKPTIKRLIALALLTWLTATMLELAVIWQTLQIHHNIRVGFTILAALAISVLAYEAWNRWFAIVSVSAALLVSTSVSMAAYSHFHLQDSGNVLDVFLYGIDYFSVAIAFGIVIGRATAKFCTGLGEEMGSLQR